MSQLEVRVLGPWEVSAGPTTVSIPPGHLRSLLSSLVLADGQPVLVDTLAEQLWGERQPSNVRGTLSTYATRLRRLLGRDVITSYPGGGYSLAVAEDGVDLHRFWQLLRQARAADSSDDELVLLHQALGLWRGRPFTGVESGWLQRDVVPALSEQWFTATERRIDLDLARGGSSELIAELRQLTNNYSFRESLWVRLIGALHTAGRRADALAAYQQVRSILRDDLGIDPGEELRQLHQVVLQDRPPARIAVVPADPAAGPHQLPHDNAKFVGRENDLAALDKLVATVDSPTNRPTIIVAIDGAAGAGKTTLAVHWAHRVAHRYPDVQLYLNLRGYSAGEPVKPAAALEAMLRSLGIPIERIPVELDERSALLRSTLAGRRTLILLDDVRDAAQVRALLPGADSLVILTSRNQLRALSIRHGAQRLTLQRLSHSDAVKLLGVAAGHDRVAAEPEAAGLLADLCDRLPLALAIVAEHVQRADTLSEVVQTLSDEMAGLEDFGAGTDIDLHAALSWSYRTLEPTAAALFRKLGLHPANDISLDAAAALAALPVPRAKHALDQLVEANMVEQRHHNRYELHDLIRLYATEEIRRTETSEEIEAGIQRILDWYLHASVSADRALHPTRRRDFLTRYVPAVPPPQFADQARAIAWFQHEFECLRTVVRWAATPQWGGHAWRIVVAMTTFLDRRIAWREGADLLESAFQAARAAGDRTGEGYSLNSLACIQLDKGELTPARGNLEQALRCFTDTADQLGVMMALGNLGMVLNQLGEPRKGLRTCEQAVRIGRELGYRRGVANNLDNMGAAYSIMGEHEQAIESLCQANVIFTEVGDIESAAYNLRELGRAYAAAGETLQSVVALQKAVRMFQQLGNRRWHAVLLDDLGKALCDTGHPLLARACWRAALVDMREFGDPRAHELERLLAEHQVLSS